MASVRGEFIKLGGSSTIYAANMIREIFGTFNAEVGDEITVPNTVRDGDIYVRLTAIDGPVYVSWGDVSTGSLDRDEMRLTQELPEAVAVRGGQVLTFSDGA